MPKISPAHSSLPRQEFVSDTNTLGNGRISRAVSVLHRSPMVWQLHRPSIREPIVTRTWFSDGGPITWQWSRTGKRNCMHCRHSSRVACRKPGFVQATAHRPPFRRFPPSSCHRRRRQAPSGPIRCAGKHGSPAGRHTMANATLSTMSISDRQPRRPLGVDLMLRDVYGYPS